MFKMLPEMRRRGRPAKRRVPAELSAPVEEHIDESVNVPIPPPVFSKLHRQDHHILQSQRE